MLDEVLKNKHAQRQQLITGVSIRYKRQTYADAYARMLTCILTQVLKMNTRHDNSLIQASAYVTDVRRMLTHTRVC